MKGLIDAFPIVLGYLPVAFAYGVSAKAAGLSCAATLLMSLIVYAGAAQMIAVTLFVAGQPLAAIVATTFVVNLRGLMLSTALVPYIGRWRAWVRALFGIQVTDETFAIHVTEWEKGGPDLFSAFLTNAACHFSWFLGSLLGFLFGSQLPDIRRYGLDYALAGMFIALVVLQIKNRRMIVVAIAGAAAALFLKLSGLGSWAAIGAAVFGATVGVVLEERGE